MNLSRAGSTQTTSTYDIYCDTIRYLTQNKSPSKKKGFVSIIEDYPLSGWRDSNSRPPAPKAGALTGLRHTPIMYSIQLGE